MCTKQIKPKFRYFCHNHVKIKPETGVNPKIDQRVLKNYSSTYHNDISVFLKLVVQRKIENSFS